MRPKTFNLDAAACDFFEQFNGKTAGGRSQSAVARHAARLAAAVQSSVGLDTLEKAASIAEDDPERAIQLLSKDMGSPSAPEEEDEEGDAEGNGRNEDGGGDAEGGDAVQLGGPLDGRSPGGVQGDDGQPGGSEEGGEEADERANHGESSADQNGSGGVISRFING